MLDHSPAVSLLLKGRFGFPHGGHETRDPVQMPDVTPVP